MFFDVRKWEWWWERLVTYLPFFWVKSKSIVEGTGFSYSSANSILVFSFINFFFKKKYPKKISSWSSQTLLFHIQIQFIASTSIKLSFHFSGYLTFGFYLAINFFLFFYFFFISFLIDRPFCLLLFFRSLSTAHFIAKIVVRFKSQFPCNKHEASKVIPNACKADCIIVSTSV